MASQKIKSCVLAAFSVGFCAIGLAAQTAVWTYHNNNARTGANTTETILTPGNVNAQQFGLLERVPVDGDVYAEPLYVPGVQLSNGQTRNLVFVATENDSVYAFDAQGALDGAGTTPVWVDHFTDPSQGIVPQSSEGVNCWDLTPDIGITGTPVIDLTTGTLYVVAETMENGQPVQRLHALDLATGAEKFGGPVVISAAVAGTGSASAKGQISFDPLRQFQRAGLLLNQGLVYVAWGSHCDVQPFHGWLMAFSAATLQLAAATVTTPNEAEGGIWGGAPAADDAGAVYVASGNGGFDPVTSDLGESVIRLNYQNGQLAAADYFSPYDQDSLSAANKDLSSQGVVLLPPMSGEAAPEAVAGDKAGDLYVLNRNDLGGYIAGSGPDKQILQEMPKVSAGVMGTPAYWNGYWYQLGTGDGGGDYLQAFTFSNGLLSAAPAYESSEYFHFPAGVPVVSADGNNEGIVWLVQADAWATRGPEVLHAYNAENLQELYNSGQNASRDQAGPAVKFAAPTVADGQVFLPAGGELDIYGLFPGQFTISAQALNSTVPLGSAATIQVTSGGTGGPIELACTAPTKGCSFSSAQLAPGGSATLTVAASALAAGTNTITISATQGGASQTTSVIITAEGFSLAANPSSTAVLTGQPATFQIAAAAQGGYQGGITLACTAGSADCQLAPSVIDPGQTSMVTLTHLPAGQITQAEVTGSSSLGANSSVTLTARAWDFSVTAAQSGVTVLRGANTANFTLATAGMAGFTGSIALSCVPATGLSCAFSPATVNAGGGTALVVSGLASAATDPVNVTVSASSGSDTHTVPLTVAISDFAISAASNRATVTPGQTATYGLKLSPVEGWSGNIALTCAGAPQAATCTITPASVSLNGSSQPATVTVATTAPASAALPYGWAHPWRGGGPGGWQWLLLMVLGLGVAAALAMGKRRLSAALAGGLLALSLAACGGGGAAAQPVQRSTPHGSSTLTITASSGSLVHTQALTLTVN